MAFDVKNAKVEADGTLVDKSGNKIAVGTKGYVLIKARVKSGGTFTRKKKSKADFKSDLENKRVGTFKWYKGVFGMKGYTINKSGYNAITQSIIAGNLNLAKVYEVMVTYKKKCVSSTIIDVSNGKKTKESEAILKREANKELRAKEKETRNNKKLAEKNAKFEKQIREIEAKKSKLLAQQDAKIIALKKSM